MDDALFDREPLKATHPRALENLHGTPAETPTGGPAAGQSRADQQAVAGQQPSVGRIVHYVAYGTPGGEFPSGVCRAAIITEVDTRTGDEGGQPPMPAVGLMVANPTGQFFNRHIRYDFLRGPGTWHWPERV